MRLLADGGTRYGLRVKIGDWPELPQGELDDRLAFGGSTEALTYGCGHLGAGPCLIFRNLQTETDEDRGGYAYTLLLDPGELWAAANRNSARLVAAIVDDEGLLSLALRRPEALAAPGTWDTWAREVRRRLETAPLPSSEVNESLPLLLAAGFGSEEPLAVGVNTLGGTPSAAMVAAALERLPASFTGATWLIGDGLAAARAFGCRLVLDTQRETSALELVEATSFGAQLLNGAQILRAWTPRPVHAPADDASTWTPVDARRAARIGAAAQTSGLAGRPAQQPWTDGDERAIRLALVAEDPGTTAAERALDYLALCNDSDGRWLANACPQALPGIAQTVLDLLAPPGPAADIAGRWLMELHVDARVILSPDLRLRIAAGVCGGPWAALCATDRWWRTGVAPGNRALTSLVSQEDLETALSQAPSDPQAPLALTVLTHLVSAVPNRQCLALLTADRRTRHGAVLLDNARVLAAWGEQETISRWTGEMWAAGTGDHARALVCEASPELAMALVRAAMSPAFDTGHCARLDWLCGSTVDPAVTAAAVSAAVLMVRESLLRASHSVTADAFQRVSEAPAFREHVIAALDSADRAAWIARVATGAPEAFVASAVATCERLLHAQSEGRIVAPTATEVATLVYLLSEPAASQHARLAVALRLFGTESDAFVEQLRQWAGSAAPPRRLRPPAPSVLHRLLRLLGLNTNDTGESSS